jgi:anti-sigma regulatory factor (Ser/Thr protein kinase)
VGTLLTDDWIGRDDAIEIVDDAAIAAAREAVRRAGAEIGLEVTRRESAVAATSELARNQLVHAAGGAIAVHAIVRGGVAGIEVVAADRGDGIADPTAAIAGVPRPTGSLGVGLSAAYRQVDEMDVDVREGEGTCIRIRTFVATVARREVGVLGRPFPGEVISGDHARVVADGDDLVIGVVDGLGHGAAAREPSDRAAATLRAHAGATPAEILARCHDALAGTRGAVMSVIRLAADRTLEHAGVGNVATRVFAPDGTMTLLPTAGGVVGAGAFPRRITSDRVAMPPGHVIAMATDGLMSRIALDRDPILRRPLIAIAHHLIATYGRGGDDALVVVVR